MKNQPVDELKCLAKLVDQLAKTEPMPVDRPSTTWKAYGDSVFSPSDISKRECSYARLEKLAVHISVDCRGLGPYNVAVKTTFDKESEVAAALLHAAKGKMLCELRVASVRNEDVVRLKVHDDNLSCAYLVCRMETFLNPSSHWQGDPSDENSSDKHRLVWLISTDVFLGGSSAGSTRGMPYRDIRGMPEPHVTQQIMDEAYQKGTVHVIMASPNRDYSTRTVLEPDVAAGGSYLGVFLPWVGNRYYQHSAITRHASQPQSFGLGILRSAFTIKEPWCGEITSSSTC